MNNIFRFRNFSVSKVTFGIVTAAITLSVITLKNEQAYASKSTESLIQPTAMQGGIEQPTEASNPTSNKKQTEIENSTKVENLTGIETSTEQPKETTKKLPSTSNQHTMSGVVYDEKTTKKTEDTFNFKTTNAPMTSKTKIPPKPIKQSQSSTEIVTPKSEPSASTAQTKIETRNQTATAASPTQNSTAIKTGSAPISSAPSTESASTRTNTTTPNTVTSSTNQSNTTNNTSESLTNEVKYSSNVAVEANTTDYYNSMTQLENDTIENVDWKKETKDNGSEVLVVAPHGGGIEQGTSELTKLLANEADYDYFSFEGIRPSNNSQLHVTSTRYDDPTLNHMIQDRKATIAIHGAKGDEAIVYLGGLKSTLKDEIQNQLERYGFVVETPPDNIGGLSDNNFINSEEDSTGIQLELTSALRKAFFKNGDLSADSRTNTDNWTATMYDFSDALYTAIQNIYPEN
ncbi:poly-gamma-glutamate hydrolase family protein [Staphylococcus sp. NAM3COL9]|uniref:poly-gamma-glutamate hydrolase family protein n=1 Tax=Staphylococcus sp. NAM3COL9 TaxID=1667172 RepID=UPI000A6DF37C|nr:poly-gamma-glutamate hydrolase family protein [Staphylococcus sp. NAM3COL9]